MTMRDKQQLGWLFGAVVCCAGVMLAEMHDAHAWPPAEGQVVMPDMARLSGASMCLAAPGNDADEDDEESNDDRSAPSAGLRKLRPEEINRIRFMELRAMRMKTDKPDRVRVTIPKQTMHDYLAERAADPLFSEQGEAEVERQRRAFLKLTAAQKLHWIAQNTGTKYVDRVAIKSDPEVFKTFKKNVMPAVLRGCAKPGCHASTTQDEAIRFRLFKDPRKGAPTTYANFIMLNDTEVDHHQMIDRSRPENSLLLTYLLPAEKVKAEFRHPGGIGFKPTFQSRKAPDFRRIEKWIRSLKHPAEDYGVWLVPRSGDSEAESGEAGPEPDNPGQRPSGPDENKDDAEPKKLP